MSKKFDKEMAANVSAFPVEDLDEYENEYEGLSEDVIALVKKYENQAETEYFNYIARKFPAKHFEED